MIHHYMTKYVEGGKLCVESWLQIGSYCFSRKIYQFNMLEEKEKKYIIDVERAGSDGE